jgi:hypothetical protein
MPLFSEYSLYSAFASSSSSYNPYSPVAFRSGFTPSTGYSGSSGFGSSSGYGGYSSNAGRSNRYGPLLTTIVESGLSPSVPRRGPRSAPYVPPSKSNYTPTTKYTPMPSSYTPISSRVPYQRPMYVDTENIDVSTPRKPRRMVEPEKSYDKNEKKMGDSDTRGTIKRGRTVVRIHTKHLKENPDVDKRKKMTPGERLKEKFMIRDKESERRKKDEEEERLREIERQEIASRRRRLMCVEQPAPVVPQMKTITEDLKKDVEKTPENSESSGSDTETEETEAVKRLTRKKKRRKSSVKKEPPVAPPRVKRPSFDAIVPLNIEEPEPKKLTVKNKERMKSVKCGGISKRGGTKKNIILPPKSSTAAIDEAPVAPQRGRKFSADEKESPVEQVKVAPKWPQSAPKGAKGTKNVPSDKTNSAFSAGVANKIKNEAYQQRKSEPFGDTMKSFSNFFLNFGKKTDTKITTEIVNKEPPIPVEKSKEDALNLIIEVQPEPTQLETKLVREDSTETENTKRDRGISNVDFKPKQSVKFRENKVSDRLARFVEKKDFNKENNAKLMKALSQDETMIIKDYVDNSTDKSDNGTIINASEQRNEVAKEVAAEISKEIVEKDKSDPIASENGSATRKSPAKIVSNGPKASDAETAQKPHEKAGKKAQSSVTPEHVEQPKQDQTKPAAERSPPKDSPKAVNQAIIIETKAKAANKANDNTKSMLAEERVDLKPLASKTEEAASAKIGNGGKATANSEQVETVCQIKDASTSPNNTNKSETDSKKSPPPPLKTGDKKEKVQTPTEKKFPWLNKKEDSKFTEKSSALKIEAEQKSPAPKTEQTKGDKESQLEQVADTKSDANEVNAAKDKKFPWLAKKQPSPAQQPDKISMPEASKKDAAAEELKQTLETDTPENKNIEKISPDADSPTSKKLIWQISAEIMESTIAKKSPQTPVKKKDAGKIFLFDKETVSVVADREKNSSAGVGTESKAAETKSTATEDPKPQQKSGLLLQNVPAKNAKSQQEAATKKQGVKAESPKPKDIKSKTPDAEPIIVDESKTSETEESVNTSNESPKSPKIETINESDNKIEIKPKVLTKAQEAAKKFEKPKEIKAKLPDAEPKMADDIKTEESLIATTELLKSPKIETNSESDNKTDIKPKVLTKAQEAAKRFEKPAEKVAAKAPDSPKKPKIAAIAASQEPESPKKPERSPKEPLKIEPKAEETNTKIAPESPKEKDTLPDFSPKTDPTKQSLKMLQSMANEKLDSKSQADSNIILAKDSVKQKPLILRSRSSTIIKKQPKANLALSKPPEANFPAPQKALFMDNALTKLQEAFNKNQQQQQPQKRAVKLKKMRAHTDLSCELIEPEPTEEEKKKEIMKSQSSGGLVRGDRHTIKNMKYRTDRVSTSRHQAMKMSLKNNPKEPSPDSSSDSDEDSDTETETETDTSGSDTETEEGQVKVDRNSTSSEDSGFGSNQNSPQASTNSGNEGVGFL